MASKTRQTDFKITRTIVVRISGPIDGVAVSQLERILYDLIDNQGVADLIVDLADATGVGPTTVGVVHEAQKRVTVNGGRLAVRAPSEPPAEFVQLASEVVTYTTKPLEPGTS